MLKFYSTSQLSGLITIMKVWGRRKEEKKEWENEWGEKEIEKEGNGRRKKKRRRRGMRKLCLRIFFPLPY